MLLKTLSQHLFPFLANILSEDNALELNVNQTRRHNLRQVFTSTGPPELRFHPLEHVIVSSCVYVILSRFLLDTLTHTHARSTTPSTNKAAIFDANTRLCLDCCKLKENDCYVCRSSNREKVFHHIQTKKAGWKVSRGGWRARALAFGLAFQPKSAKKSSSEQ